MILSKLNKLIVFKQSFFGLPWVAASSALALYSTKGEPLPTISFWVAFVLAFFSARALGMSLNRLIDYQIDAKNPRTKNRPLQIKIISRNEVKWVVLVTTVLFVFSSAYLNSFCLLLSPIVLFQLYAYSFTKRFTSLCHFFLGSIHFFAPIFAWVAITGELSATPLLMGFGLWLLIAGNDMIYALQDYTYDLNEGLMSIPVKLGETKTLWLTRGVHAMALMLLSCIGVSIHLGPLYFVGLGLTSLLYVFFHYRVSKKGKYMEAFSLCNIYGGLLFFLFTLGAIL